MTVKPPARYVATLALILAAGLPSYASVPGSPEKAPAATRQAPAATRRKPITLKSEPITLKSEPITLSEPSTPALLGTLSLFFLTAVVWGVRVARDSS